VDFIDFSFHLLVVSRPEWCSGRETTSGLVSSSVPMAPLRLNKKSEKNSETFLPVVETPWLDFLFSPLD
jgi:hypothetical protein